MNFINYFKKKPKIVEFDLLNFNEDMDKAWSYIVEIYEMILKRDEYWHFFYEGEYSIIRCSKKYKDKVENYLKNNSIEYKYKGAWIDGSEVVEMYKNSFIRLFHEYSLIALQLDEKLLVKVADRVCHCFLNHCTYIAKQYRDYSGKNFWEGSIMGHLAVARSHYIGKLDATQSLKRTKTDQDKLSENI